METLIDSLNREELATIRIGRLFAGYGYSRYRMGKFETYDMYLANKAFLDDQQIITFTDGTGKLMALKPDVTMSIVKNLPADVKTRKVYYNENVFRMRAHGGEYHEIAQMGVEYIGAQGCYPQAEVVMLAAETLAVISPDYILNMSHMGFVAGIFDQMTLAEGGRAEMLEALRNKNSHSLKLLVEKYAVPTCYATPLLQMATLGGQFAQTLERAKSLCITPQMESAWQELSDIYHALEGTEVQSHLGLDFSLINDDDYYNGVNIKGFIPGLPRAVLAGGRYDKLLRRFGKPQCAMGFALVLGELTRMLSQQAEYDVDGLLLYSEGQSPALVMSAVQNLMQLGTVRAETSCPQGFVPKKLYQMQDDGSIQTVQEVPSC